MRMRSSERASRQHPSSGRWRYRLAPNKVLSPRTPQDSSPRRSSASHPVDGATILARHFRPFYLYNTRLFMTVLRFPALDAGRQRLAATWWRPLQLTSRKEDLGREIRGRTFSSNATR